MTLKQLSVFLENKPGALSRPCRLLASAGINLQTFALADTREFGILRLVVHEWERARALLETNDFIVRVSEVVALEVPDRPGGLADLLEIIERARINVEYMYAFTAKQDGKGLLLFRFDNPELAIATLQASAVNTIGTAELFRRLGAIASPE
ncbi:MAG: amino acid-binding protein [Verrucomicrobiota bacterium]